MKVALHTYRLQRAVIGSDLFTLESFPWVTGFLQVQEITSCHHSNDFCHAGQGGFQADWSVPQHHSDEAPAKQHALIVCFKKKLLRYTSDDIVSPLTEFQKGAKMYLQLWKMLQQQPNPAPFLLAIKQAEESELDKSQRRQASLRHFDICKTKLPEAAG